MWQHIRANTGDNQQRLWDFHVEDFMPERMALNLSGQKRRFRRRITSTLTWWDITCTAHRPTVTPRRQLFKRLLREAVLALPGFQFGDIAEDNLSRSWMKYSLRLMNRAWAGLYGKPVERGALSASADPAGQPAGIRRSSGDASLNRLSGQQPNYRVFVLSSQGG